jgi:multiple sugar transport system substrate-binding protein
MTTRMSVGLALAGVVLLTSAILGEKSVSRQEDPARVTVVYWEKWTGAEADEMRKVINAFNASQDRIFVKYLTISAVDSKTMLAVAGGDPPDLAGMWLDQLCQFADANAVTDLSDMAAKAGLNRDYYIPAIWNGLNYRGKLWGLPTTPAWVGLHVRKDLVPAKYASPETFPKTFEDLDAFANEITKKNPDGSLKLAGFLPSDPGWWNWAWPGLFGGKLIDGDQLTINSEENVRAFEWIAGYTKRFGAKEVTTFQSGFGAFASPQDPFMAGKVATEVNGVWKGYYISQFTPNLQWFAVPIPYPRARPDLEGHAMLNEDIITIPKGSKHPKEAFEFIRYLESQSVMEHLCVAHGKDTPLAKVSDWFYKAHPNPYIRMFEGLGRSPRAMAAPQIGILPQLRAEMDVVFQEVSTGEKAPRPALDEAQTRLAGLWKTYKEQVLSR